MKRRQREPWTSEEDEVLRQAAFAGRNAREIAGLVGRTESAVRTRAYTLRIPLRQIARG